MQLLHDVVAVRLHSFDAEEKAVRDLAVGLAFRHQAEDFALAYTSVDAPGEWAPLIEHQPGTRLLAVDAFSRYLVVSLRRNGLTGLRVTKSTAGRITWGRYALSSPPLSKSPHSVPGNMK